MEAQLFVHWFRLHFYDYRFSRSYELPLGDAAAWYVQAGASVVSPDGGTADTVPSGKAGLSVAATDSLGLYGEVSFLGSGDASVDRGYGTKAGIKYVVS